MANVLQSAPDYPSLTWSLEATGRGRKARIPAYAAPAIARAFGRWADATGVSFSQVPAGAGLIRVIWDTAGKYSNGTGRDEWGHAYWIDGTTAAGQAPHFLSAKIIVNARTCQFPLKVPRWLSTDPYSVWIELLLQHEIGHLFGVTVDRLPLPFYLDGWKV